jgi:hypothetical protein
LGALYQGTTFSRAATDLKEFGLQPLLIVFWPEKANDGTRVYDLGALILYVSLSDSNRPLGAAMPALFSFSSSSGVALGPL